MYPKVIFLILFPLFAFSQSPQKINFQSILRNTNGEVVANKSVSLKISILSGSISGSSVYSETHTKTTDISGLISLQIGNGTVLSGVFGNIGWGSVAHFIKLEADFSGGNSYVLLGTQELMSVPYALYASKAKNPSGIEGIYSFEFPEGLSTDIVNFQADIPYTVPNGKSLYITSTYYNFPLVNGIPYGTDGSNLLFSEGTIIQGCEGCVNGLLGVYDRIRDIVVYSQPIGFTGFLVNKSNKIIPVLIPLNDIGMSYTVPTGKILVLLSGTGQASPLCIGSTWYQNNKGYWLFNEGTTIKNCNSTNLNPPRPAFGYTGYLIDK
jgi:hypothetical protein